MAAQIITQEYLRKIFDYKDGNLYWKINKGTAKAGSKTGTFNKSGYYNTTLCQKNYRTHRLIFMWHYGFLPKELDHKDGNPLNNNIENLRTSTRAQNCKNTKIPNTNKSGIKGVSWIERLNKWVMQLQVNGKKMYFGLYHDLEYASFVADVMRHKYHQEFARKK